MISTYTLAQSKLLPNKVSSIKDIKDLAKKTGWAWVDCLDPSEEETRLIGELVEKDINNLIKSKKVLSTYEKVNGFVMIQLIQVDFEDSLKTHPIYVFMNGQTMITLRTQKINDPIERTMETLQDCVRKVTCETSSSFVISRLFHEIVNENLNIVITLRERICEMEQAALKKTSGKKIEEGVFNLKREINRFERILLIQRDILTAIQEGIVPSIVTTQIDKIALNHTISNLSRELSLISSHSNALDNVLTVRGLGMIHKVETNLIYLTIALVILTILLILLEVDITRLIFG